MNVLGIDLSLTGTGLAILTDNGLTFHEPELPKIYPRAERCMTEWGNSHWYFGYLVKSVAADTPTRWKAILQAVLQCAQSCDQIVIENYAFGAPFRLAPLAELGGIVRFHLNNLGFTPLMIAPSTLKKFVTGKGNADKNVMLKEIYRRYHVDVDDDNMADAFALARLGQALKGSEDLSAFQAEIIEGLRNPKPKTKKREKVLA